MDLLQHSFDIFLSQSEQVFFPQISILQSDILNWIKNVKWLFTLPLIVASTKNLSFRHAWSEAAALIYFIYGLI